MSKKERKMTNLEFDCGIYNKPSEGNIYIYIINCYGEMDNKIFRDLYVGKTNTILYRLRQHKNGGGSFPFSQIYKYFDLAYIEQGENREITLINESVDDLEELLYFLVDWDEYRYMAAINWEIFDEILEPRCGIMYSEDGSKNENYIPVRRVANKKNNFRGRLLNIICKNCGYKGQRIFDTNDVGNCPECGDALYWDYDWATMINPLK